MYNISNEMIPQDKRKEINDKILFLIDNNLCEQYGVTQQDVYDGYTGDGHLHGLNFNDFNNYHEFSEAKRQYENGQFFSSPRILQFISQCIKPTNSDVIADFTSGKGDFFNFCPVHSSCYSNELDVRAYKIQKFLYPKVNISQGDMRGYNPPVFFDIVFGNPPFGLKLNYQGFEWNSENLYIQKAIDLLKVGGLFCFLIPQSYCNDDFMCNRDITFLNTHFNFIVQFDLPDDSFKHVGIKSFPTKVMFFQKKSEHIEDKKYSLDKLVVDNYDENTAENIYNEYIKPVIDMKNKKFEFDSNNEFSIQELKDYLKNKIRTKQYIEAEEKKLFEYKLKKLRFDISTNSKTKHKLQDCDAYYNKFLNQRQPEGMGYEDWQKHKITENKVLAYFKRVFKEQNKVEKDIIKLVKNTNTFSLKAYSKKTKQLLKKTECVKSVDINNSICYNDYPFEENTYKGYIKTQQNKYNRQLQSFDKTDIDKNIQNWLDSATIYDSINNEEIKLNSVQQEIVNKQLQKDYGYIQASQGSGKSLMAIHMALYRQKYQGTKNTLIIAPSIAINGTWCEILSAYQIPFKQVKCISDIADIKENDFVLITFNMMIKLHKHIKKFIKLNNHKVYSIIDEADGVCNINSKSFKAVFNGTFRSKYKTCLSGTMTRNNITEAFTQLLWLYGSSYNFMCECENAFNKSKDGLKDEKNKLYQKPFPMYKKGMTLFKSCFNPEKITVMGIKQHNQDIYNADKLKDIIDKTIITKSFEEIVGRKIYTVKQNLVSFNSTERELYRKAIEDFKDMKHLFTSTGNPRKDKMLEILQQLNLLLDICRFPQWYKEYDIDELPNKYQKVLSMLNEWNNEYVAIGCRSLKEVDYYKQMIESNFSDRKLFVITGDVSITERKKIINELEKTGNGILLSTQQSLSSSVNINFVDKVIITSSAWNYSSLSQYYFRFIRYNSTRDKEVHFVMYDNSLECNLLGLLLAKEKLTRFMKNEDVDDDQLNDEFGVDFNLIDMLLSKEKDSNNKVRIKWGMSNV